MTPLPPGSTIGILGGGQLGRMLAMAAAELGYHVHIFCPDTDSPASEVAHHTTIAAYDDLEALHSFARQVDVITYEFENIPATSAAELASHVPLYPSPRLLAKSQHRLTEKLTLNALGVPTAPFEPVTSLEMLKYAATKLGLPAVLKTATLGYDGKGQRMLETASDIEPAWQILGSDDLILEGFVSFRMEISVIIARGTDGSMESYCPVQNNHRNHILAETIAPAPIDDALAACAERLAQTVAEGLDLVGLLAIEMFVADDGRILVNEVAPRPHNSGHWTMDACITSQFTQTIRAVCGLPLGSPTRLCDARMENIIGDDVSKWENYLGIPNAKLHLYGKKDTRPGRKMGHVTFLASKMCS